MRSMKIRMAMAAATLSVTALVASACSSGGTEAGSSSEPMSCTTETQLSVGAGLTGGVLYTLSVAMKKLIDEVPCVSATVSSGNSADFYRAKTDIIFPTSDTATAAMNGGTFGFSPGEKYDNYRAMVYGYDNASIILTKADFSGTNVADLKPSDVLATTAASTVGLLNSALKENGVSPKVTVIENYDQIFAALRQGQITAAHLILNHPAAPINEASQTMGLKALAYSSSALEKFQKANIGFSVTTIPKGAYPFITKAVPTWSRPVIVVVKSTVPKALVKQITELFYAETKELVKSVPPATEINFKRTQAALDQGVVQIPWAAGSKEYLESKGVTFPKASTPSK